MAELLAGLSLLTLALAALGGGWAAVLRSVAPPGRLGYAFLALTIGLSAFSIVFSWGWFLGLGSHWTALLTIPLAATGWILALIRDRPFLRNLVRDWPKPGTWLLSAVLPVVLVCCAAIPQLVNLWSVSLGMHIGPDGLGWGATAQGLGHGLSLPQLISEIESQTGLPLDFRSAASLGQTSLIPSVTNVVESSYLLAGGRVGFPGAVGSFTWLAGPGQLWPVQLSCAAAGLLAALMGVIAIVRARSGLRWTAAVAAILLALNVNVLNAWHEGGFGQVYVFPFVVLLAWSAIAPAGTKARSRVAAAGISTAGLIPAYPDTFLAITLTFGCFGLLALAIRRNREALVRCAAVGGGMLGALALIAPLVPTFLLSTVLRSDGLAMSGWPQPHWLNPAEVIGLWNSYYEPAFSSSLVVEPRSQSEFYVVGLMAVAVVAAAVLLIWRGRKKTESLLLISAIAFLSFLYAYTRYLVPVNNYGYTKAVAMLMPVIALCVGSLAATVAPRVAHTARRAGVLVPVAASLLAAAVATEGMAYVVNFRQLAVWIPQSTMSLAYQPATIEVLDRHNLLAAAQPTTPANNLSSAISTLGNMRWLNQGGGRDVTSRADHPVALAISASPACPDLTCLASVPSEAIKLRSEELAVISLAATSRDLVGKPADQMCLWADQNLRDLGGPHVDGTCQVVPG